MMNPANLTQSSLKSGLIRRSFNQGKASSRKARPSKRLAGAVLRQFGSGRQFNPQRLPGRTRCGKLGSGQADAQGSLYSGLMGQQNTAALNNFWNANNIASGNAATGSKHVNSKRAGNSGSSSAGIYGTAGSKTPSTLNSLIGAAGTAGSGAGHGRTDVSCRRLQ